MAAGALKPLLGIGVTPALAALFMASSSSLVVLSSLGLKLYTRPGEPTARELAVSDVAHARVYERTGLLYQLSNQKNALSDGKRAVTDRRRSQ